MAAEQETLLRAYEFITLSKQCDERFRAMVMSGQLAITWFSARGQEIAGVASVVNLCAEDYLITTYRGLPEQLAKGMTMRDLWAEWMGKAAGPCKGKAGPIHVIDPDCGVMVNTGIIGAGLPIAAGLALASKLKHDGRVTLCTFGDGQTNTGAFHEALNLAALWQLPVVFLCINNGYAETTAFAKASSAAHVADRATAYGIPGATFNGNDFLETYEATRTAVDRARRGEGPTLLEAETYRLAGHYSGDDMGYIPKEELSAKIAADPVPRYREWLLQQGYASEDDLAGIDKRAVEEIEEAYAYAVRCPEPDAIELEIDTWGSVQ